VSDADEADDDGPAPDLARLHVGPAVAFVRGRLAGRLGGRAEEAPDEAAALALGRAHGLRLHRFKRTTLPRVTRALGALRGLGPATLLDVGSGRGTALWPLLEALPATTVVALDRDPVRARDLGAVARGGVAALRAVRGEAARLPFATGSFDGATALEVLEHVLDPAAVARELLRVARRFVVASVPSVEDDNPEHLRLFSVEALEGLFLAAGARRVSTTHVLSHRVAVVLR
jgi:ubiquinone/menaquinone biosynthesis C-methylase UbiE